MLHHWILPPRGALVVGMLLQAKADPNAAISSGCKLRVHEGARPLHLAAQCGRTDTARLLLRAKAAVNAAVAGREKKGQFTALHIAVQSQGYVGLVELLLESKANSSAARSHSLAGPKPRSRRTSDAASSKKVHRKSTSRSSPLARTHRARITIRATE